MAIKITQLPSGNTLTGNELLEAVQAGNSVKITTQSVANLAADITTTMYQIPESIQTLGTGFSFDGSTGSPDDGYYEISLNPNIPLEVTGGVDGSIKWALVQVSVRIEGRQSGSSDSTFGAMFSYMNTPGIDDVFTDIEFSANIVGGQILPDPASDLSHQKKLVWVPLQFQGSGQYVLGFNFNGRSAGQIGVVHKVLMVVTNTDFIPYTPI